MSFVKEARADTFYVPDQYLTIQDAINSSSNGDIIKVNTTAELYRENIVVNKEIRLVVDPVIDAMGGIEITVEASNVSVENFTILNASKGIYAHNTSFILQNVTINNCTIYNCTYYPGYGIEFNKVNESLINNTQVNNTNYSIRLSYSSYNTITNNNVVSNYDDGIWLCFSTNNTISNCNVYSNNDDGIWIEKSSDNTITYSNIYNNTDDGIVAYEASNTQVHYCNIYGNADYGIYNYNEEKVYQVDATYNWWGHASGPYHPTLNPFGKGDNVSKNVLFKPWLEAPYEISLTVSVVKPRNALYIFDREIISLRIPVIIGGITIEATASSTIGIEKVEFYIDNVLKFTDTSEPYSWKWDERAIGMHEIKVIAYNSIAQTAEDRINVFIINF
ncbi:MAG: right-handed parallel beta-helix repeat-containing protein [Thermoplasmatales archaeon]|nr:right-handed parallel beta-helix repeat-containing protein [Thermoplasmatales archaeon]